MESHLFVVCFLLVAQNAFAQVLPVTTGILGNAVTGNGLANTVVSGIGNTMPSNFADSSAIAKSIGMSLANNAANNLAVANGASNLAVANSGINNLAGTSVANFNTGAANVAVGNFGVPSNNFNFGSSGISLGGLTNVKFGEVEYFNDGVINGYSGEYPMIGYVTFEGYLPATGTVSVAGDGCSCK